VEGTNPVTGGREVRMAQDEESFAALAFKVMMDEGRNWSMSVSTPVCSKWERRSIIRV